MEILVTFVLIYLAIVLIAFPVYVLVRLKGLREQENARADQLRCLEEEIRQLRVSILSPVEAAPVPEPPKPAPVPEKDLSIGIGEAPVPPVVPAAAYEPEPPPAPEPLFPPEEPSVMVSEPVRHGLDWEQFLGAKLFAWLGGLALFLCAVFFVKYSFEHDLIPPEVRVAIGFMLGTGLLIGGLRLMSTRYLISAHTLCATGIVTLYAVTFACNAIYHFAFFSTGPSFALMCLITATAFIIAVRAKAQTVAILGILGGFLTPILINTGQDNPPGLFGYTALLVVGLSAVALHRGWQYLVSLGALGTGILFFGWASRFLVPAKSLTALIVLLSFSVLFLLVHLLARRQSKASLHTVGSTLGIAGLAFFFAFSFLGRHALAVHPGVLFGYIFLLDVILLAMATVEERLPRLHLVAGMLVFFLLSIWFTRHLADATLYWGLGFCLVFAVLHSAYTVLLQRIRPDLTPTLWSQLFPPLTLLLLMIPICRLDGLSLLLWPVVFLVDLLAIGLALLCGSVLVVAAVLVLSLVAAGLFLFQFPAGALLEPSLLLIIGFFAVFFVAAGLWLSRRLGDKLPAASERLSALFGGQAAQVPAFSALLPFILLMMVCGRLEVPDPSSVFGLGLLLVVLVLGLSRLMVLGWLPLCALVGMGAVEWSWYSQHFSAAQPLVPLLWFLGLHVLFSVYPFVFLRVFKDHTGPWVMAALSGVVHFGLVYQALKLGWPNEVPGLIPAAFAVVPLASLVTILKSIPEVNPRRLGQVAWFGGTALLFITLVFPIQFDRQWITLGWALEGTALLWLFHRVPHPGLRLVGVALLVAAFLRLALNPAVLDYEVRGGAPLLNWYLYAYGLTIASLFAGARLLAPPRERVLGSNAPRLLATLGTVLSFLLLNLEIADYFCPPGTPSLLLKFSGSFALDMSYTIGWSLFALGLIGVGIWKKEKAIRYAAIALMSVALLKLFLHDLARLQALYRVGALFAVAVVAILASFAYQRFLLRTEEGSHTPKDRD